MVAVIVLFELLAGLPEGLSVDRGKLLYVFAEVVNKFFFTYPADVIICLVSGNVLQVVQNFVTPVRRANLICPSSDFSAP